MATTTKVPRDARRAELTRAANHVLGRLIAHLALFPAAVGHLQQLPPPFATYSSSMGTRNASLVFDVDANRLHSVHSAMAAGLSPNLQYNGVYPLNLAIERGYVDMAAILLKFKANPLERANGRYAKNALQLAEKMATDPKEKWHSEASLIINLINDSDALDRAYEKALIEVERLNARENQIMSKACIVIYALMATAAAWYWFFGRGMKVSGQHGGEL